MRTYGTADLVDGVWQLMVEPHVAIRLKRLFSRIGNQFGVIEIRDSDEVCRDLFWFTQRYPLKISDPAHLQREATAFDTRTADFAGVLTGRIVPREFEMALPAREYQRIAADLALRTRGLLVADDLGLGKTAVAIAMLTDPRTRPALVVTLTHLPKQWEREIAKFVPDMRVHVVTKGSPYDIAWAARKKLRVSGGGDELEELDPEFPDVVVMNYQKLSGWAETLSPVIKSAVFDEAQELRRSGSQKAAAARHLAGAAEFVLGLSATPIYNYGGEIYNVMEVICPEKLGTWVEFATEWCGTKWADRERAPIKEPKAFGTYVREQGLMIRRTRAEVRRELPPLLKIPHHVESDPEALDAIEKDVSELAKLVLSAATRIERRDAAGELDWKLRQATGIAKAPYVADFVKMLLGGGAQKVLLYGWHRDVYEIWKSKLKDHKPVMYTGSESPTQKDKAFALFNDPISGHDVLMMSLRAGAGLDGLQYGECTTIVFGELDWSPAVHDQNIGRVHRDGQADHVTAYFLIADSGSDPVVADTLGLKRAQIDGLQDPTGSLVERLEAGGGNVKKMAEEYLKQRGISLPARTSVPESDEASLTASAAESIPGE